MLIHPWDAATGSAEWQDWLASTGRFGILAVNNLDPARAPLVGPTHFTVAHDELLIHLARPNPIWPHLEAAAEVRLAMTGDYAYIPTYWRAKAGGPDEDGVPTSYYTAVQFLCRPAATDHDLTRLWRRCGTAVRAGRGGDGVGPAGLRLPVYLISAVGPARTARLRLSMRAPIFQASGARAAKTLPPGPSYGSIRT
jgi:Putative FMN-binding domain